MHLDNIPALISSLAGDAVVAFVVAVILDDVLGVLGAVKAKAFDFQKLPSFLESQFGSKQALALLGIVVGAYATGQLHDLQDAHQAALAAVTAGGGALTLTVLRDAYAKLVALAAPAVSTPKVAPAAPAQ